MFKYPMTGIAVCCAPAAIGHAAAVPAMPMKSRRRIAYSKARSQTNRSQSCRKGSGGRYGRAQALSRKIELRGRKLSPAGLTEREKAEYTKLEALFHDDDRLLSREFELTMKQFNAEVRGGDPLSDEERRDVAELKKRFPPDPERAKLSEPFSRILRKLEEQEGKKG
jgi:hypothetical protein